mgnify:CR=1 FL=1
MAKVIQPPQINHLDELLDVLVNQDKYIQYMKGLQAMRDGIAEALGVVFGIAHETDAVALHALATEERHVGGARAHRREGHRVVVLRDGGFDHLEGLGVEA